MLAPVSHTLALTTIVRRRELPVPGEVIARLNRRLLATDVVAEADFSHSHHLIDVAHRLELKPDAAEKMIKVNVGDHLAEGTVVARGKGIIPKTIKVEHSGSVVAVGGGQILLDISGKEFALQAGISGEVIELLPKRGVVIREVGALVQGVWGNGKINSGTLHALIKSAADIMEASQIDISLRGYVLLAGSCQDAKVLRAAADNTVRGLILSSLHPSLLGLARKMPYPIIVTDAIGRQTMNPRAYKILSTNAERENVTVNAEPYHRYSGARPEVVIPLEQVEPPPLPQDALPFEVGQKVRLRRAPHAGSTGTLKELSEKTQKLPNGLRVLAGKVQLDQGEQVLVPLVNLEVLG